MTLARKKQNAADLSPDEQKHVRAVLRYLRSRLGDWANVAKVLRYARSTVADMVGGETAVSASVAFRVARFLQISIDEMLAGNFVPPSTCPYCKQMIPEDP